MEHHDAIVQHARAPMHVQQRPQPVRDDLRRFDAAADRPLQSHLRREEVVDAPSSNGVATAENTFPEKRATHEIAVQVTPRCDGTDHLVRRPTVLAVGHPPARMAHDDIDVGVKVNIHPFHPAAGMRIDPPGRVTKAACIVGEVPILESTPVHVAWIGFRRLGPRRGTVRQALGPMLVVRGTE